jgi:predicted CoA-binding protein
MTTKKMVDEFMSLKKLALFRNSPKATVMGADIQKELNKKGYSVSLVYLEADGSDSAITNLNDLPEPVEGVIIAVPAKQTVTVLQKVVDAGIKKVWMQLGSESKAAIQFCEEKGLEAIYKECVMMFAEPVKSIHAFHRWLWKIFGKLPK